MTGLAGLVVALLGGCGREEEFLPRDNSAEVDAFFESESERVTKQLKEELRALEEEMAGGGMDADELAKAQEQLNRLLVRLEHPEFFTFASEADVPADLDWQTGMDQPEIGSPEAKKGGTWNTYFPPMAFPPTIRAVGKEANNGFRSEHWDYIELALVGLHPNTMKTIPSLADRWAVAPNGRTVYFHIDDEARWSDGEPVTAEDFFMTFYVYLSPYLTEPWYRTYYSQQFWNITRYSERMISITLANAKPMPEYFASIVPWARHFYSEFGPDFEKRYNWRTRPSTGAYVIREEDIDKGRSITLSRVKDWWAKDRKYYRNLYNADRIHYSVVRDENKLFELFRQGQIDFMPLDLPKFWYEKTEIPEVFDGFIHKTTFYNVYPRIPRGLFLNHAQPLLGDRDVRIGLQHATNWQKVVDFDLRGDAKRLNILNEGYGRFSNNEIRARPYDPAAAREAFARAGFDEAGSDRVLRNAEGKRLSFTITYTRSPFIDQILQRLKEEAVKAGVEYKLEGLDGTASYQKVMRKEHHIAYWGWGTAPPYPRYRQGWHSDNAFDANGKPKPQTNNISSYARPEVDELAVNIRNATDEETIERCSKELEQILHDDAVWIPAYARDFYRVGYWRWMKWPEEFNVMLSREGYESYVWWIDTEEKQAALEAKKKGGTFPEVNAVYDKYRENGN